MANEFIIRKGFKSQEDSQITGSISLSGSFKDQESSSGTAGQVLSSTVSGSQWVDAADSSAITGTGTTGKITKWTTGGSVIGDSIIADDGSTITVSGNIKIPNSGTIGSIGTNNAITILSGGQVGIGGTPSYPLHVSGNVIAVEDSVPAFRLIGGTTSFDLNSDGGIFKIRDVSSGNELYHLKAGASGYHNWYINDSLKMTLDSSGNLGIGVTPSAWRDSVAVNSVIQGADNYAILNRNDGGTKTNYFAQNFYYNASDVGARMDTDKWSLFYSQNQEDGSHGFYTSTNDTGLSPSMQSKLTISSGGNVGINNTIPSSFFGNASQLVIGDGSTSRGMTIYSDTNTDGQIFFADGITGADQYRGIVRYEHSSDALVLFTNATEKMRISSGGDATFGGGSSTNRVIQLQRGTQGSDSSMVITYGSPYLSIGGAEFRSGNNTIQTIGFGYHVGTGKQPAEIGFETTNTGGGTKGDLVFAIRNGTTVSDVPTEKMRITSTGDVLAANASTGGNLYVGRNGGNGSTAASQQELFLRAYSLYQTSDATYYGSYGFIQFNADNNWTSGARKFAITNGYLGTNFAILRSTSAREDIVLDGNGGATSTSIVDFTISNNGLATFFTPLKVSNASATIILNDANSDSSGSSNEFVMTDYNNNEIFRISKIANTLDTEIANVLNGNLLFRTNNTVRLTISSGGAATFASTISLAEMATIIVSDISTGENRGLKLQNTGGGGKTWNVTPGLAGSNNSNFTIRNATDNVNALTIGSNGVTSVNGSNAGTVFGVTNTSTTTPYGVSINMPSGGNNTSQYFIGCGDGTQGRFYVWSNGNVQNTNNSYGAISDIKLKENISDATPKLNDLLTVKIRNYNLIGDNKKQIGVIAQELEEIFPSMVEESPDTEDREVTDEEGNVTNEKVDLGTTTKSVKYSVFTPMLIKAIQEQQTIIEDLKSRIETLEG